MGSISGLWVCLLLGCLVGRSVNWSICRFPGKRPMEQATEATDAKNPCTNPSGWAVTAKRFQLESGLVGVDSLDVLKCSWFFWKVPSSSLKFISISLDVSGFPPPGIGTPVCMARIQPAPVCRYCFDLLRRFAATRRSVRWPDLEITPIEASPF